HAGGEIFDDVANGGTGVLSALRDLTRALDANDAAAIRATTADLDAAFDKVQTLLGDVGARASLLQVSTANLDALEINLETLKSELEEVDIEEAVTELMARQTSYQAAMLTTSRVMGLTLTDYLR